jgi:serine/threonine protein kinase
MGPVGAVAEDEPALPVGTVLNDRWRVRRVIGRGGMSIVYAAEQPDGTLVALKVLHDKLARNRRARERFLREVRLANALDHADAVRVLESGPAGDDRLYLTMELLEGRTLREASEGSVDHLPVAEVVRIGEAVLGVLEEAHRKGIVHRDIKPANVFLTSAGNVKVLDFGIATVRDVALCDATLTQSGATLGTPAFMAPEQARGRHEEVDARTDVWALGATLFWCLTGRYVHEEASTPNEALIFAGTQRARQLATFRPDLAFTLGPVIDRALEFRPDNRWASAEAMRAAIHDAWLGAPGSEVRVSPETEDTLVPLDDRTALPERRPSSALKGMAATTVLIALAAALSIASRTNIRRAAALNASSAAAAPLATAPAPAPEPSERPTVKRELRSEVSVSAGAIRTFAGDSLASPPHPRLPHQTHERPHPVPESNGNRFDVVPESLLKHRK